MERTLIFDTHEVVKKFIDSGFTEEQAEIVIREQKKIIENNLANKQDIEEVKKEQFEIKREIAEINQKTDKINIKIAEINQKTELIQKEQLEIKKDIEFLKKEQLEIKKELTETKKELADFKHKTEIQIAEIKKEIVLIRKEIDLMGQKIVNKMYIGIVSCLGAFVTIMKLLELFLKK